MSNEVITHKHEWVRGLFSELDRIAKDTATMADENQPLLGGEHYLTDRELSQRLKISRRTLQDYRNNGILPYRQLGGKILYRESDIERVLQSCYRRSFRLYPIGCNTHTKATKLYPIRCKMKNFYYICGEPRI